MTFHKKYCFLVDDDEDDQLIFKTTINKYFKDYTFVGFVGFEELKEKSKEYFLSDDSNHFVLFLDLNLPKTNGLDILKWIRKELLFIGVPIIIYTTSKNPKDKIICEELNVQGFVSKPSSIESLVCELEVFLSKR